MGSHEATLRAQLGDKFRAVSDRELQHGCGMVFDAIRDKSLNHLGDPPILEALQGAVKSDRGDSWRWSRKSSSADISPLVAAPVGWYVFDTMPEPKEPAKLARIYSF